MSSRKWDFIVVGSGPSGACLAARLAAASGSPSVLLLEAGGTNDDPEYRVAGDRNTFWAAKGRSLDRGYVTTPQPALDGRELPYHRGTGLGGSSATNIGVWDYGCKPDMDEWAKRVSDDWWKWDNVETQFRKIESFHDLTPESHSRYVQPDAVMRGKSGPVDVTYPSIWDPCLRKIFRVIEEHSLPLNPNISSGKGIGMGVAPATVLGLSRVTASSAYLKAPNANLHIETNAQVHRIVFEGHKASAVELVGGGLRSASKEIILCAGVIDSPKILLLSGVGDSEVLREHGISTVLHLSYIGQELKDHPMIRLGALIDNKTFQERPLAPQAEDIAAAAQGYLQMDVSKLSTRLDLDAKVRSYLDKDAQPTHELLLRVVPGPGSDGKLILVAVLVLMNCQSQGKVILRSNDPQDTPLIDLNLLSHPYDMQLAIETIRATIPIIRKSSVIPTDTLLLGPKSLDEADIAQYIRSTATHLWHGCGTVKMGKLGEKGTCVTSDFKIPGLDGLRVADMSVAPLIPSHHTQSTAYLIGERAAEIIIGDHGLD